LIARVNLLSATLPELDFPPFDTAAVEAALSRAFTRHTLLNCWALKLHPRLGEGQIPVRLCLLLPDGKRLDETTDFPVWRESHYPKRRAAIRAKYPGLLWP
jgi:hypothetical protein